jgi:hypothetical protein
MDISNGQLIHPYHSDMNRYVSILLNQVLF